MTQKFRKYRPTVYCTVHSKCTPLTNASFDRFAIHRLQSSCDRSCETTQSVSGGNYFEHSSSCSAIIKDSDQETFTLSCSYQCTVSHNGSAQVAPHVLVQYQRFRVPPARRKRHYGPSTQVSGRQLISNIAETPPPLFIV